MNLTYEPRTLQRNCVEFFCFQIKFRIRQTSYKQVIVIDRRAITQIFCTLLFSESGICYVSCTHKNEKEEALKLYTNKVSCIMGSAACHMLFFTYSIGIHIMEKRSYIDVLQILIFFFVKMSVIKRIVNIRLVFS